MKRIAQKNFCFETFDSIEELVIINDSRNTNPDWYGNHPTVRDAEADYGEWRGCESFEEARELLRHGYDKAIGDVMQDIRMTATGTSKRARMRNDIVGFAPIVPNAIIGLPMAMVNQKQVAIKNKVVTIVYCAGNPARRSAKEITKFGISLVKKIVELEMSGYRVRLDIMSTFNSGKKHYGFRVPIKSEHNPLDVKRICFPIAHPAMQRVIAFDWYERCPKTTFIGGYGQELCTLSEEEKGVVLKKILNKGEVYVEYGTDIDNLFK